MTDMTEHFLADYHHYGEITWRLQEKIKIPIRRVPHMPQWTGDAPFLVFGCTWHHLNSWGPLTEEKFDDDLEGAITDFCDKLNQYDEFIAYPITHMPPTTEGIAFHDWIGAAYPFDIRATIMLDEHIGTGEFDPVSKEEFTDVGLQFSVLTLIAREMEHPEYVRK